MVFDRLNVLAVGSNINVLLIQPETVDESYFKTYLGGMRWRQVRAGVKESWAEPGRRLTDCLTYLVWDLLWV